MSKTKKQKTSKSKIVVKQNDCRNAEQRNERKE